MRTHLLEALLLECAIRAALVATGTAAVLWLLRIRRAVIQHVAWTGVVFAMLALPVWIAVGPRLSLPVLRPAPAPAPSHGPADVGISDSRAAYSAAAPPETAPPAPTAGQSLDWAMVGLVIYFFGVVVLLARLGVGTLQAQRLRRTAILESGWLTSRRCATPITVGGLKPILILPAGWRRWPAAQFEAVITHEREHARRRDPLVQWLALLNRAIFWFHPLAWWLQRRLSTLSERVCDAAVIAAGHSPADYSNYLLDLERALTRSGQRLNVVGLAMPGSGLSDRMREIFDGLPKARESRERVVCTVALCATSSILFAAGALGTRAQPASGAFVGAQEASSSRFDVVSIKPCQPNAPTRGEALPPPGLRRGGAPWQAHVSPGYVYWDCVTLSQLVDQAYADREHPLLNVVDHPRQDLGFSQPKRVRGGPPWAETETFTIEAKAPVDVTNSGLAGGSSRSLASLPETMSAALRAVLEDRFRITVHRGTEQQTMYALAIAKGGLNKKTVTTPTPGDCMTLAEYSAAAAAGQVPQYNDAKICGQVFSARDGRWVHSSVTLQQLARDLSTNLDQFVLDRTGLEGKFNFVLKPEMADSQSRSVAFSRGLAELGLTLEATKGPAEYLVIDRAERPAPNDMAAPRASGPGAVSERAEVEAAPRFEVVSVKPCKADDLPPGVRGAGPKGPSPSPGRIHVDCLPLVGQNGLIRKAYGAFASGSHNAFLHPDSVPVEGGPDWVRTEHFTIDAKAVGTPSVELMMGPMLQAVLEDRFQLRVRRDTRQVPVYELTVAKGGPKLKPFDGTCKPIDYKKGNIPAQLEAEGACPIALRGTRVDAPGQTLGDFITFALTLMDRPVVDKTGLIGRFDIHLDLPPNDGTGTFDTTASLAAAVQQQLGLKLAPAKGPGEILVIEHIERPSPDLPSPAAFERR